MGKQRTSKSVEKKVQGENLFTLEEFFLNCSLPSAPIQLSECEIIVDVLKFLDCEMTTLWTNSGNTTFMTAFNRLVKFKNIIQKKQS